MVQNCKRRSERLAVVRRLLIPPRGYRRSLSLGGSFNSRARTRRSEFRNGGYFGRAVNPDSDRPDANAT